MDVAYRSTANVVSLEGEDMTDFRRARRMPRRWPRPKHGLACRSTECQLHEGRVENSYTQLLFGSLLRTSSKLWR